MWQLIARILPENKVVATVTVLNTTGDAAIHEKYGLYFAETDRVARFTHMAVLKPYHGLNLPLHMLLEATQRYVTPRGFTHTWLTFPADRAAASTFCRVLHFTSAMHSVDGELGRCKVLVRREDNLQSRSADEKLRSFLEVLKPQRVQIVPESATTTPFEPLAGSSIDSRGSGWRPYPALIRQDEWLAQ
jgi:hypothetical protein